GNGAGKHKANEPRSRLKFTDRQEPRTAVQSKIRIALTVTTPIAGKPTLEPSIMGARHRPGDYWRARTQYRSRSHSPMPLASHFALGFGRRTLASQHARTLIRQRCLGSLRPGSKNSPPSSRG
ncbi:MAG: hypothetical protein OXE94_15405, partial [Aestuariivita sp.]|nr:hypothetical protein [Aestuariivita sp.]